MLFECCITLMLGKLGRIDGDPVLRETRIWATWEYVSSVGGGRWCTTSFPHPQSAHKPTIPCCPPPTELTYSHVALILVPLNAGSPSTPPSFHNIQAIQFPNIMNYPKPRKQGRGRKLCPKHIHILQLSLLKYPSNILFIPIR